MEGRSAVIVKHRGRQAQVHVGTPALTLARAEPVAVLIQPLWGGQQLLDKPVAACLVHPHDAGPFYASTSSNCHPVATGASPVSVAG